MEYNQGDRSIYYVGCPKLGLGPRGMGEGCDFGGGTLSAVAIELLTRFLLH